VVHRILLWGMVVAGVVGPVVAGAQTPATDPQNPFRFELEEAQSPFRGRAVEGLRVESVDPAGRVTGEASGWVVGDVKAGGRGYFFVLVSSRAATYRATVQSFNKVALDTPQFEAP